MFHNTKKPVNKRKATQLNFLENRLFHDRVHDNMELWLQQKQL